MAETTLFWEGTGMKHVNLDGPEGNALAIMGMVQGWCRQLGRDSKPILDEMQAGDYDHLVDVARREFGSVAVFEHEDEDDESDWDLADDEDEDE